MSGPQTKSIPPLPLLNTNPIMENTNIPQLLSPTTSGTSLVSPVKRRQRHTSESENHLMQTQTGRTLYTAGRPPWFNSHGEVQGNIVVLGLCGGSGSGKTTVARRLIEAIDVQWVSLLSMDSFYKVLDKDMHEAACNSEYNFDAPSAFDIELLLATLKRLKSGKSVEVPIYNFTTHDREKETKTIYGANVIIFEGIMSFCDSRLRDLMDLRIFVETDADVRLSRRLRRDITERGRDLKGVLKQYERYVKPAYDQFISTTMCHADIIVPRGGENNVALDLIVRHINLKLGACSKRIRDKLLDDSCSRDATPRNLPTNLYRLEHSQHVRSLHTFVRNRDTELDEFIFYSKRLMRLLIEYAMSLLPFEQVNVRTPQEVPYDGCRMSSRMICGVSILRAGETLEPALREVCKDVQLGKILIQTNQESGEPELHFLRLPRHIEKHNVMLMDASVATGAAAIMAIRILLDHDVPEENIMLLSLLMAQPGVNAVAYAFPRVKIVTSDVDPCLDYRGYISPGMGNFGDRFFGTD